MIECTNSPKVITASGRAELTKYLSKLKLGQKFFLKPISEAQARSTEQNRYYFKVILPALQYYFDELDYCKDPFQDKDKAHFQMKLLYCYNVRPDLIETRLFRDPKTKKMVERATPFSWKLSEASRKEANKYLDWCKGIIEVTSGTSYDKAILGME